MFTKNNLTVEAYSAVAVNRWDDGSTPEGYSLLGCIGCNTGTYSLIPYTISMNKDGSTTVRIDVRNVDGNSVTATLKAKFLYIKKI